MKKKTPNQWLKEASELNPKAKSVGCFNESGMREMDSCICGINRKKKVLLYDYQKLLSVWMTRDKMTREEAVEWFDFNVSHIFNGKENSPQLRNIS